MTSPEEVHNQHIKELDEVLEETEGCLERVQTKRFTRQRKQLAIQEITDNDNPILILSPPSDP